MPSQVVRRLSDLYRAGMDVYPANLRGLAAAPAAMAPRRGVARGPVKPAAAEKFLAWVSAMHPKLFDAALKRANARASSTLGQVDAKAASEPGPLDRLLTTIQTLAPVYLQAKAQKELLDVQMDRARQGLPPLDPRQYAPAVNLSVDPNLMTDVGERMRPLLIYGGIALGAVFLLSQMGRGRRR